MNARSAPRPGPISVHPVIGVPEIRAGDDVAELLAAALERHGPVPVEGDVLVVSAKLFSKALGLRAPAAHQAAHVLAQSRRVVSERATQRGLTRVVESLAGPVLVAAGIDHSNTGDSPDGQEQILLLPPDPDLLAAQLRTRLAARWGLRRFGVVLADTAGRPWRHGQTDFALGAAGLHTLLDLRGGTDADGRPLRVTATAVADELAAAADLVRPKDAGVAAALARGLEDLTLDVTDTEPVEPTEQLEPVDPIAGVEPSRPWSDARSLVRTGAADWFALGSVEAVRAALGVAPGTAEAVEVGVPAVEAEDITARVERACGLALRDAPVTDIPAGHPRAPAAEHPVAPSAVRWDVVQQGVQLRSPDELTLGVAAARLLVALESEDLHGRIARRVPARRPGADHLVTVVLL